MNTLQHIFIIIFCCIFLLIFVTAAVTGQTDISSSNIFSFRHFVESIGTFPDISTNAIVQKGIPALNSALRAVENGSNIDTGLHAINVLIRLFVFPVLVLLYICEGAVYIVGFTWWAIQVVIWLFGTFFGLAVA